MMADIEDEERSLSTSATSTSEVQARRSSRAHVLSLIELGQTIFRFTQFFIPLTYRSAVAVETAQPLGEGSSFIVTLLKLPHGLRRTTNIIYSDPHNVSYHPGAKDIPKYVVYKTANIKFDDYGFAIAEHENRLRSIALEFSALAHPPLLHHPNIVKLLGMAWGNNPFSSSMKLPVLIMEYAEHGTLKDLLKRRTLTPAQRNSLALDIALGLKQLHSCSIVHGDIKPKNVLIFSHRERRYIAKLADFGFSTVDSESELVWLPGTFTWRAPEATRLVPKEQAHRTDIYSLGLVIWSIALDGYSPFDIIFPGNNNQAAIAHLKSTDDMLAESRLERWYVKWVRGFHSGGLTAQEQHAITDPDLPSEFPSILQLGESDIFNRILEAIFDQSLTLAPDLRNLDAIIEILKQNSSYPEM
jgi:serine/threonine protein kinase